MSLTRIVCRAALSSSLWIASVAIASEAPAAPDMPGGWKVVSDESYSAKDIGPIAQRLGGDIAALRNTVYEVDGKRVQLNLIVAADETSAVRIVDSLNAVKAKEFVLRKGQTITSSSERTKPFPR